MLRICRACKRDFEYNDEIGYDLYLCGPICDGIESGTLKGVEAAKKAKQIICDRIDALVENESDKLNSLQVLVRMREAVEIAFKETLHIPMTGEEVEQTA